MKAALTQFEIIIIGAGLTGLTLAIALAEMNLQVAIVDAKNISLANANLQTETELRALALSYGSQTILSQFGLWDGLQSAVTPIKHVHVTDQGHFGFVRIHATDYQLPCLGSVISMQLLQQQLMNKAQQYKNIQWFQPATVKHTEIREDRRIVTLKLQDKEIKLAGDLVISADGQHSILRQLLQLKEKKFDYQQTAIVTNVGVARTHNYTAYERFTTTGPLALLPISTTAFSLVWTVAPAMAKILIALDEPEFLLALQKAFGYRVGKFSWVGARQTFPLSLVQLDRISAERALILGNAAHTLHPIAGQGFNLALRDVTMLVEEIQQCNKINQTNIAKLLEAYEIRRTKDYKKTIGLTDSLVKIFSNNCTPLMLLRNLGLLGLDITPVKHNLARALMGFV